jgi:hypothetical protein
MQLRLVEKPLLTCELLRSKPLPETAKSASGDCGYAVEDGIYVDKSGRIDMGCGEPRYC